MDFDPNLYLLFRMGVAALGLGELLVYFPFRARLFGPVFDRRAWFASPLRRDFFLAAWALGLLGLLLGVQPLPAAVLVVVCTRVAFVEARQANLLRGAGAVGLVPWFCAIWILLFEATFVVFGPASPLVETILDVARTHTGVMLLCAGICKCTAGYFERQGFEYALANPFWSWHWRWIRHVPPRSWWIVPLNLALSVGEVVMGVALMVPWIAPLGAALAAFGYIGLFLVLKLLLLPLAFAALGVLFASPVLGASWLAADLGGSGLLPGAWAWPFQIVLWLVLAVLIATKVVQYANYYFDHRFSDRVQQVAERVALLGPELIWRVFTADLVDFFVRIHVREGDRERMLLHEEEPSQVVPRRAVDRLRFHHPAESIVMSSLFLALKYGESHRATFEERLGRYVRSLAQEFEVSPDGWRFEYVAIEKTPEGFAYRSAADVQVAPDGGGVEVRLRKGAEDLFARRFSRYVRDFGRFGNYVPVSGPSGGEGPAGDPAPVVPSGGGS